MTTHAHDPADDAALLTDDERSELAWLRTENSLLRVERDILLRVASGYAEDMAALLHGGPSPNHTPYPWKTVP
jgi:hypothetical protein